MGNIKRQTDQTTPSEFVGKELRDTLNRHGHPFQNSLIKEISQLNNLAEWKIWIPELPVEVQGAHTRIDFVLVNDESNFYLVCECKRSNPALANWCFVNTLFKSPHKLFKNSIATTMEKDGGKPVRVGVRELSPSDDLYQVAIEVKSNKKGDSGSPGRGQIEEASTQVCRQLNGLVNFFHKHGPLWEKKKRISLVPVLFTTAKLWVSDVDLSTAKLESGELEPPTVPVRLVQWLWYQYHQSPGLKHSVQETNFPVTDIEDTLFREFMRTIAVVTPAGLKEFLASRRWGY